MKFREWEAEKMKDPAFRRAVMWYRITHPLERPRILLHVWMYKRLAWYKRLVDWMYD